MEKRHDKDGIDAGRQRLGICDAEACGCVQSRYEKEKKQKPTHQNNTKTKQQKHTKNTPTIPPGTYVVLRLRF